MPRCFAPHASARDDGQMNVLWTARVDGGDGKELYGEDFADIYAINRLHFKAASPLECDHVRHGSVTAVLHSSVGILVLAPAGSTFFSMLRVAGVSCR